MTTRREFNIEEVEWLQNQATIGRSHTVVGNGNLAACEDCEWNGQGDTFEYLMEQVTAHLGATSTLDEDIESRREEFKTLFGWDPWEEGVIVLDNSDVYGTMKVTDINEVGKVLGEVYLPLDTDPEEYDFDEPQDDIGLEGPDGQ